MATESRRLALPALIERIESIVPEIVPDAGGISIEPEGGE